MKDDLPMNPPKPFLKWVGGKRQLLPELRKSLPEKFKTYYEPFVGGGALFFDLRANGWKGHAVLGDMNENLIRAYRGVQTGVEAAIRPLEKEDPDKAYYLINRDRVPDTDWADSTVAVWLIYLNKCCFNGLYRVNREGKFNVPFGKWKTPPTICDAEGLRAASRALRKVQFRIGDFEKTVRSAEAGDLCYFDPPYVPLTTTANFTGYTAGGFGYEAQVRLRDCALKLVQRGVHVILSNSNTPLVRMLYSKFDLRKVMARRAVNSKADSRGPVGELIITGRPR